MWKWLCLSFVADSHFQSSIWQTYVGFGTGFKTKKKSKRCVRTICGCLCKAVCDSAPPPPTSWSLTCTINLKGAQLFKLGRCFHLTAPLMRLGPWTWWVPSAMCSCVPATPLLFFEAGRGRRGPPGKDGRSADSKTRDALNLRAYRFASTAPERRKKNPAQSASMRAWHEGPASLLCLQNRCWHFAWHRAKQSGARVHTMPLNLIWISN